MRVGKLKLRIRSWRETRQRVAETGEESVSHAGESSPSGQQDGPSWRRTFSIERCKKKDLGGLDVRDQGW